MKKKKIFLIADGAKTHGQCGHTMRHLRDDSFVNENEKFNLIEIWNFGME